MFPEVPFYFIRHGQTGHNARMRFAGDNVEAQLTEIGVQQAVAAAPAFLNKGITRIISSPLQRAHITAERINEKLHLPLEIDENLREQSYGAWEERLYEEICAEHGLNPDSFEYLHHLPPDAESFPALTQRVVACFAGHLHRSPGPLLFVAHGGIFNALHYHLLGTIEETANAQPYRFTPSPSGWQITLLNSAAGQLNP